MNIDATTGFVLLALSCGLALLPWMASRLSTQQVAEPSQGSPAWLVPAILIGAVVLGWLAFRQGTSNRRVIDEEQPTSRSVKLDQDWALMPVDGGPTVRLDSLKGKVLFINLWATWCPPCVEELPSIQALYNQFKDTSEVAFVLVSLDDDRSRVAEFVKHNELTVPIYTALADSPRVFQTRGIPATFLVSKSGQLAMRHVGGRDWNDPSVVAHVKKLLSESLPTAEPVSTSSGAN